MSAKEKVREVLRAITYDENIGFKLLMITRHLKDGMKVTEKIIDRFQFKANRIDISPELKEFFQKNIEKQLTRLLDIDGYQLESYSVITDDLGDKLYTYALNNALSFSDVINNQLLKSHVDTVSSLSEVKNQLWAYCIEIVSSVDSSTSPVYLFRKMGPGKIMTDDVKGFGKKILSFFDSKAAELKSIGSETISFDEKIDCIYFNSEFLVLSKSGFEQIVGLEEEFQIVADDVISAIEATGLVDGIEHIKTSVKESRALLKTLTNIGKKRSDRMLTSQEIEKMEETLQLFEGRVLRSEKTGRLTLENSMDVNCFVRMLNDYYKQGLISGEYYGTNAGNIVRPNT